jgi:hypothetical protein
MGIFDGGLVVVLFLVIVIAVLLRLWARPYLEEAIAIRKWQTNGEPYEPPAGSDACSARGSRRHWRRLSRHGRMTMLVTLALMPFAMLADPRNWLRDVLSDCAEADSAIPRVLLVLSHLCSAPNRISVVWSGRCRRLLRLLPR